MDSSHSNQQESSPQEPSQDNFLMSAHEQVELQNGIDQEGSVFNPNHSPQNLMSAAQQSILNPNEHEQFVMNAPTDAVNMNNTLKTLFDNSSINEQSQEIHSQENSEALSFKLAEPQTKNSSKKSQENAFFVTVEADCDCKNLKCVHVTALEASDDECNASSTKEKQNVAETKTKAITKPKRGEQIITCGHTDRKPYAHGMCRACYHTIGRTRTATECPHTDRPLYARGMCKACYLRVFYRSKFKKEKVPKNKEEIKEKQFAEAAVQTDPLQTGL